MSSRPRILTRQQSSFLNEELDDFFVNNSSHNIIGPNTTTSQNMQKTPAPISRKDSIMLETFLEEFYQTNIDSTLEENVEEHSNNRDNNEFFNNAVIATDIAAPMVLKK